MSSFLSVITGFILSGIIVNHLIQAWQQRNWVLQQRFLGHEKEYLALKDLSDEIASLLGARIYHMIRLTLSLRRSSPDQIKNRRIDHDTVVKQWNERLTSFYFRLPLLANYDLAFQLENSIQNSLVAIGSQIDDLLFKKESGKQIENPDVKEIIKGLHKIQGKSINFNKKLLGVVADRRREVYYGLKVQFSLYNLEKFSTWQLFKALFIRDVNSFSIIRPALDHPLPFQRR